MESTEDNYEDRIRHHQQHIEHTSQHDGKATE